MIGGSTRLLEVVSGYVHLAYHRLSRANYDRQWISRRNRTPAGTFRCYEPRNRHGNDPMLAQLEAACEPSAVVFDVGANVGIYALALASDATDRHVVAFEPAPPVASRLRENVRLNDLEDRIEIRACGIGDEDGTCPFYRSTNPELSSFVPESARRWGGSVADVTSVPVRRLDSLVVDGDLPPPDAIKIDVEGTESEVLRGARTVLERHRPLVVLEVHEDALERSTPAECRTILEAVGYAVHERDGFWHCRPDRETEE